MRTRRYFTITWSLSAAVLISVLAFVLATRLHTDFAPAAAARIELDVAGLAPGELRTFRTWEGEFWVVRRTAAQIAGLERDAAATARIAAPDDASVMFGQLRSADREYFVFRVQRLGDGIMLRQFPDKYLVCSDVRLFRGTRSYAGGYEITDGLSCADDPQIAYDLAGRAASPYLTALEVPRHEAGRNRIFVLPEL